MSTPIGMRRLRAKGRGLMGAVVVMMSLVGTSLAQQTPAKTQSVNGGTQGTITKAAPVSIPSAGASLQSLWQAPRVQDYTAVQLRRFFDAQGLVATVREQLISDANGTDAPDFALSYMGVVGQLTGSPVDLQWAHTYHVHADRFHRNGSFHVRDLAKAQQNYTLHAFGSVMRAGRATTRVVIFPAHLDKGIWVLDVDQQTSLPLYSAEFDRQFRLLSEVEVVSLSLSAQLPTTPPGASAWTSTVHASFGAAVNDFERVNALVEPDSVALGEYQLREVLVRDNPLNQRKSLHLTYTDGVDEFFLVEELSATDPFAGLPSQLVSGQHGSGANTIARYRDHTMSVLLFWDGDVSFQLTGRGSLARLDSLAKHVYTKALLN